MMRYVCQKLFLTNGEFMFLEDILMISLTIVLIGALLMVLLELKKLQKKIYHHDDRPKTARFWGHGKKK